MTCGHDGCRVRVGARKRCISPEQSTNGTAFIVRCRWRGAIGARLHAPLQQQPVSAGLVDDLLEQDHLTVPVVDRMARLS
jgi:hypothetical protein